MIRANQAAHNGLVARSIGDGTDKGERALGLRVFCGSSGLGFRIEVVLFSWARKVARHVMNSTQDIVSKRQFAIAPMMDGGD